MTGPPSPKRQRTGEKDEAAAPAIDAEKLQKVLESIASVDEDIEKENEKMAREILKIESKFNATKRPFLEKRGELLRDIPGFWKQALLSHPFINESFGEGEDKVLDALENLDVKFIDDAGGFKIELTFGENPYFDKGTLWKQITYKEDGEEGEFEVKTSGVKWKTTAEANEVKDNSTFIEWFVSTEGDQDIAEQIKDDLWKTPVAFYLQDDSDGEEEGEDDGEGEGEDEDDSAEDEE